MNLDLEMLVEDKCTVSIIILQTNFCDTLPKLTWFFQNQSINQMFMVFD